MEHWLRSSAKIIRNPKRAKLRKRGERKKRKKREASERQENKEKQQDNKYSKALKLNQKAKNQTWLFGGSAFLSVSILFITIKLAFERIRRRGALAFPL